MSTPQSNLSGKIADGTVVVGVVGLGYVGLPLVLAFRKAGFKVVGYDIDGRKIERLRSGQSYIRHIPDTAIREALDSGSFDVTVDFARLPEADALLLCVPTPLTVSREPDMRYIQATVEEVARTLRFVWPLQKLRDRLSTLRQRWIKLRLQSIVEVILPHLRRSMEYWSCAI